MNRVARFEKVSINQFRKDFADTLYSVGLEECGSNSFMDDYINNIYNDLCLPRRATSGSAGYDFFIPTSFILNAGDTIKIPTGKRCKMEPGWALMVFPRSSLGFKYQLGIANTIPIIDMDYYNSDNEGHIFIKLVNNGDKALELSKGDKFVQGVFLPYGITEDDNANGIRNGGLGSTD